jgi:O-methyltransferase
VYPVVEDTTQQQQASEATLDTMVVIHQQPLNSALTSRGGGKHRPLFLIALLLVAGTTYFQLFQGQCAPPTALVTVFVPLASMTPTTGCLEVYVDGKTMITPNAESEPEKCLLHTAPSRYMKLLMDVSVGLPRAGTCSGGAGGGNGVVSYCSQRSPYNAHERQFGNDHPPDGYTMVGKQRLENFRAAIQECIRNNIPGSIVELGVWRGGAMLVAAGVLKELAEQQQQQHQRNNVATVRDLYLFDAYDSIDVYSDGLRSYLSVSVDSVRDTFAQHDLLDDHVHFVKGMFNNSLPSFMKEYQHQGRPIAVLRVDGNFYDSYQDAMYHLYEAVPVGGIVIFDDVFSHPVVKWFWDDFRADQGLPEELVRIDHHSGWFRKTKAVTIDWTKFRRPRDANIAYTKKVE